MIFGDCSLCDGYVLDQAEAPFCPTCAREHREYLASLERYAAEQKRVRPPAINVRIYGYDGQ